MAIATIAAKRTRRRSSLGILRTFVGFDGRIGRLRFFLCTLILVAATLALAAPLIAAYGADYGKTPEETRIWTLWSLALDLLLLYPTLTVTTRRLHDLDRSGWWNLPLLLPTAANHAATLAGLTGMVENSNRLGDVLRWVEIGVAIVVLVLALIPGTKGNNRYGPSPFDAPRLPMQPAGTPTA
jgi:uncharacterized membrane protein YhaH (DUF805 family)